MSPQEILVAAKLQTPGLGIATVYRNLRTFLEEGWLQPVDLPGAPSRYEVAGKGHHHHFHCRACDRVFELNQCTDDLTNLVPPGFKPESHDIILYGLCPTCAS